MRTMRLSQEKSPPDEGPGGSGPKSPQGDRGKPQSTLKIEESEVKPCVSAKASWIWFLHGGVWP